MRHILTSVFLIVLLFPALALGGEVKLEDLVITNGLYFKKFTNIPFTGKVTEGKEQGRLKDGKRVGVWVEYNKDGRVSTETTYENGKEIIWVLYGYHSNGQVNSIRTLKKRKRVVMSKGPFQREGPTIRYWENGQLQTKGTRGNWHRKSTRRKSEAGGNISTAGVLEVRRPGLLCGLLSLDK